MNTGSAESNYTVKITVDKTEPHLYLNPEDIIKRYIKTHERGLEVKKVTQISKKCIKNTRKYYHETQKLYADTTKHQYVAYALKQNKQKQTKKLFS